MDVLTIDLPNFSLAILDKIPAIYGDLYLSGPAVLFIGIIILSIIYFSVLVMDVTFSLL